MSNLSKKDPRNRPNGYFIPNPKLVGFILGAKGQKLRDLAKSNGDGTYIRYNDHGQCFQVWAHTYEAVQRAIDLLAKRQKEALQHTVRPDYFQKQVIKIGHIKITIEQELGTPDIPVNITSYNKPNFINKIGIGTKGNRNQLSCAKDDIPHPYLDSKSWANYSDESSSSIDDDIFYKIFE